MELGKMKYPGDPCKHYNTKVSLSIMIKVMEFTHETTGPNGLYERLTEKSIWI